MAPMPRRLRWSHAALLPALLAAVACSPAGPNEGGSVDSLTLAPEARSGLQWTEDLASWEAWGDAEDARRAARDGSTTVAHMVSHAGSYLGQELVLEGVASRVCLHRGCWLSLDAGDEAVDVRIDVARDEDDVYRFTVPPDLVGRRVIVKGTLRTDEPLATDVDPESGEASPERRLRIVAVGVLAEPTSEVGFEEG